MRKFLVLSLLLLCAVFLNAQAVPTTPNIGLYTPYHGTANWDTYMNSNFTNLDNFFGGSSIVPQWNMSKAMLQNYLDFTAINAPANPASGTCRVYFDLGSGLWKGINSTGASCSPSGNNAGTTGQLAYYASNGTILSPDTVCTISTGNLVCASFATTGLGTDKIDFATGTSPGNPASGHVRLYGDSTSGLFTCLTPTGASCLTSSTNTQMVFNDNGILAGNVDALWNKSTQTLTYNAAATLVFPDGSTRTSAGTNSADNAQYLINNATDSTETFTGHTFVSYTGVRWLMSVLHGGTSGAIIKLFDNSQSCSGLTFANGSVQILGASATSGLCVGDVSGSTAVGLPSNTVGTTQATSDNSTKVATTAFVNSFAPLKIAAGTATMTTAAIASGACGSTVTVAATGVATTDTIEANENAAVTTPNGLLNLKKWPTSGNVNFAYCNPTAGSQTPTAATVNWRVAR